MPYSNEQLIREHLARGAEQAGVEFKAAGIRSDATIKGRVIRAMLAMANRSDGGLVIIGVREAAVGLELDGLTRDQADSWKHDFLADAVAEYADPRVVFETAELTLDGATLVVVTVATFDDVPVVCKRTLMDGRNLILRDGAVYVRSNRKPESREVANFDEMRALLELATDRGVRRFVQRAQAAGLSLSTPSAPIVPSSDERFARERGDL